MKYIVIDFSNKTSRIYTDKKAAAKVLGLSVPTFGKLIKGKGFYMLGYFLFGIGEEVKSKRGGKNG